MEDFESVISKVKAKFSAHNPSHSTPFSLSRSSSFSFYKCVLYLKAFPFSKNKIEIHNLWEKKGDVITWRGYPKHDGKRFGISEPFFFSEN